MIVGRLLSIVCRLFRAELLMCVTVVFIKGGDGIPAAEGRYYAASSCMIREDYSAFRRCYAVVSYRKRTYDSALWALL